MSHWSRLQQHGEQTADCFLSSQAAESALGEWSADFELRPLAFAMQTADPTPAGLARRLEEHGASSRLAGRYREAQRDYLLTLARYRRFGSLHGVFMVAARLAELFVATDHLSEALSAFVLAGNAVEGGKIAHRLNAAQAREIIGPRQPRWERIVVYKALEALGAQAEVNTVSAIAAPLIEDAAGDPPSLVGAELVQAAKLALAAVSLQLCDEQRAAAFAQLTTDLRNPLLHDAARGAAIALIRATHVGVFDARDDLTDCFLDETPIPRVEPDALAALLGDRADLISRLTESARRGSTRATLALLWVKVDSQLEIEVADVATRFTEPLWV